MEATRYRIKVAKITDLPMNLGKTIKIGALEIALFRLANGDVRAIENRCPHKGCVNIYETEIVNEDVINIL
jgi:nitrite reductase (NADH) small subunit